MISNVRPPGSAPPISPRGASNSRGSRKKRGASFDCAPVPVTDTKRQLLAEEEWTRLHLALGLCPQRAARWFAQTDPLLGERYQLALVQQVTPGCFGDYPLLHDPLEDAPEWHDAFKETEEMLAFELELAEVADGPGYCLFVWQTKAHILREEFGLEWFSPAQMNPLRRFA